MPILTATAHYRPRTIEFVREVLTLIRVRAFTSFHQWRAASDLLSLILPSVSLRYRSPVHVMLRRQEI